MLAANMSADHRNVEYHVHVVTGRRFTVSFVLHKDNQDLNLENLKNCEVKAHRVRSFF